MKYLGLATDGDGTLMRGGRMAKATVRALERLRDAGVKLILTTGESPKDLASFPHLDLFDRVVAENGAALYRPSTQAERLLAVPPPAKLARALRRAGVKPVKTGRVIVSTVAAQERIVREVLRKFELGRQLIFNRKELMLLPSGVTKATGLAAALRELRLPPRRVVAVGDAENDLFLLDFCGLGVAVANAIPQLKGRAKFVTEHGAGRGFVELADRLLEGKLPPPRKC